MRKTERIADMERMYRRLTDPETRDEARRETERRQRAADKKADTGL